MDTNQNDQTLPPQLSSVLTGGGLYPTSTGGAGRNPARCNNFDMSNAMDAHGTAELGPLNNPTATISAGVETENSLTDMPLETPMNCDQERGQQQSSQGPYAEPVAERINVSNHSKPKIKNKAVLNKQNVPDLKPRKKKVNYVPLTMEKIFAPLNWSKYITIELPQDHPISGLRIDRFLRNLLNLATPYFRIEKNKIIVRSPSEDLSKKTTKPKSNRRRSSQNI